MTLNKYLKLSRLSLAITAAVLATGSSAQASMTLQLYDNKVVFGNDGLYTVGVHVNECQDRRQLLWTDSSVTTPLKGATDGFEYSYPITEEGFSPPIQKIVSRLNNWIKLPAAEKVKAADSSSRAALKEALAEKCVIKRASEPVTQSVPQLDANGCPPGKKYYERREGVSFVSQSKWTPDTVTSNRLVSTSRGLRSPMRISSSRFSALWAIQ